MWADVVGGAVLRRLLLGSEVRREERESDMARMSGETKKSPRSQWAPRGFYLDSSDAPTGSWQGCRTRESSLGSGRHRRWGRAHSEQALHRTGVTTPKWCR